MPNVILYARVSTAEQATDGVSLDAQKAKLIAYANLYDLTITKLIVDAGESAKSLNRPGLQEALTMLRRGEADGIVVAKLDRLTRNVGGWQGLIDDYFSERKGKALYSVADSIDTTTAGGRLVLNVLLSVAQWEREAIAERTVTALSHKKSRGERTGQVGYGWVLGADGVQLLPCERERSAIALIQSLRLSGLSLRRIASELELRHVPKKDGKVNWSHTQVDRILKAAA